LRVESARKAARAEAAYAPLELGLGASSRSEIGATDQDLFLSQPLDLFGRQSSARAVGDASVQSAVAEFRALALELQTELLTAYAEAVAAKHQSEVAGELLTVAEAVLSATQRRFDEGKIAAVQVTRASIERSRARQTLELRKAGYEAATQRLAGLLGATAEGLTVASVAKIEPLANPEPSERPDLLAQRAAVAAADAEARAARASSLPELNVQLVRSPWGDGRGTFAGRIQLTWAAFDHGRVRASVQAARLRAESAQKLLQDVELRAAAELKAAQIELAASESRIRAVEEILQSVRELVTKSQRGFAEGIGTQLEVLEATRALREVEQELIDARRQFALAVIAQYEAAGFVAEVLQ
jgi:cobalt-zinc-cadmium efflux system outer membrane protein